MKPEILEKYAGQIDRYIRRNYREMFREPDGIIRHKFIVPGSGYTNQLWDWDSWLTNVALRNMHMDADISAYEKGCILNFTDFVDADGRMPISIKPDGTEPTFVPGRETNIHKPVLAQHALFVSRQNHDFEWIRDGFEQIERYIGFYRHRCRHKTGLYYWIDDYAIGVDNDPCTFYRPPRSSGSIFLNCLMYRELEALAEIANELGLNDKAERYRSEAAALKQAVQENCWDARDGFYYSVDLNLLPIDPQEWLHSGAPRHWDCLIQRIGVWSGFLPMWAGIATREQAERMVKEHYWNRSSFNAPHGVRTLSKQEKMYAVVQSGNPSCWLGPVWGISNYLVFEGLRKYGFNDEAADLAEKSVALFGRDLETTGAMHEYYHPETGEGISYAGFQNWNLFVHTMATWLKNRAVW